MARPEASVPQQMTYKAENLIELKVGISEATMLNLQRLQDVLSQKHRMDVSLSEAIAFLVEFSIDRLDPVRKAERAMRRSERRTSSQSEAQPSESPDMSNGEVLAQLSPSGPRVTRKRGKMPSSLVHLVQARDQGQCTHVDANLRHCPNRRWLEIHHLHPVSRGGPDDPENLTLLCSGHHKMTHAN